MPGAEEAAIALDVVQGALGLLAGGDIGKSRLGHMAWIVQTGIDFSADNLGRPTADSTKVGLRAYFDNCRSTLRGTLESTMSRTVSDMPFAFTQMDRSRGPDAWFKTQNVPLWREPWKYGQTKFEKLLSAWTASKTMAKNKIFLHVEHDHQFGDPPFPGERWINIPGDSTGKGQSSTNSW